MVPEFPQSRSTPGARRPLSPTPVTIKSDGPGSSMTTPMARRQLAVEKCCPPRGENPAIRVVPSQSAPSRRARCPMLLSDGTGTLPARGLVAGCITIVVIGWGLEVTRSPRVARQGLRLTALTQLRGESPPPPEANRTSPAQHRVSGRVAFPRSRPNGQAPALPLDVPSLGGPVRGDRETSRKVRGDSGDAPSGGGGYAERRASGDRADPDVGSGRSISGRLEGTR